jgi:DNA-binding NtrC family response regulator
VERAREPSRTGSKAAARPAYRPPKAIAIVRRGEDEKVYLPIYPGHTYTFGRDDDATVVFRAESISRQHGRLTFTSDGKWVFRDLGSLNGSYLSDFPLDDPDEVRRPIPPGSDRIVSAGKSVHLANAGRIVFLPELPEEVLRKPSRAPSNASRWLEELVREAAALPLPVLLIGPTGSGKTFLARQIHQRSRRKGSFVSINCGRLPTDPSALQSELLGHKKGSFTGATYDRTGKLFHANEGTLFLDEVECLSRQAQEFLLDVIEGRGDFSPLGGKEAIDPPRFRLIAATKVPLAESGLREDLGFRLSTGTVIALPGLEERQEDIPSLVESFLQRLKREQHVETHFEARALQLLQAECWPGHVRQLEGVVTAVALRAAVQQNAGDSVALDSSEPTFTALKPYTADEAAQPTDEYPHLRRAVVTVEFLQRHLDAIHRAIGIRNSPPPTSAPLTERWLATEEVPATSRPIPKPPRRYSRDELQQSLERNGGNLTQTARELGMVVNTLKAKMKQFGIPRPAGVVSSD